MKLVPKQFSDLVTFTRASGGTSFRPVARGSLVNLTPYSTTLADSTFTKVNMSVVGERVARTNAAAGCYMGNYAITHSIGTTLTAALKVKRATTATKVGLRIQGAYPDRSDVLFDLVTGLIVGTQSTSYTGASSTAVADGAYWIVTLTTTAAVSAMQRVIFGPSSLSSVGGWEAQTADLSDADIQAIGVFAGTVTAQQIIDNGGIPVTFTSADNVIRLDRAGDPIQLFTAPANTPRIDYDPATGACKGLLIEEARTNLANHNRPSLAAVGVIGASIGGSTSQLGITLDVVAEDTSNGLHRIEWVQSSGVVANTQYRWSCYVAPAGRTRLSFQPVGIGLTSSATVVFTLVGSGSASIGGADIVRVADGLYRVSVTSTTGASPSSVGVRFNLADDNGNTSYQGDGVSGLAIGGVQFEAGAFVTSLIPTTGAAATRAIDIVGVNTMSPWYNSGEGTLFVSHMIAYANQSANLVAPLGSNEFLFGAGGTLVRSRDGVNTLNTNALNPALNAEERSVMAYTATTMANCRNGGTVGSSVHNGTFGAATNFAIGRNAAATTCLNGHIRQIRYIPKRLTNAELQALTA